MRNDRKNLELRKIEITTDFIKNADASCLIKSGDTHVVCTASIEEKVPRWLKGSGKGWVTAEYGMLPRSTHERMRRESSVGKVGGRTSEIQRLIGRSLRASMNLKLLGEYLITIDCDVLQADGGTRTASITGGFVALKKCIDLMIKRKQINHNPIKSYVAAISCGIVNGEFLMDLDYEEDSQADVDSNYVMNDKGDIIELQLTGEQTTCSEEEFMKMLRHSKSSIAEIITLQKKALSE
ncbi:ribonuclease PH [Candidatus Pelagibacter sp. IMCC9063]|uniref:ribonuclease PH n=1 Tax=Pelagibacter sp. (strain IMCC9063) TaxID=1002672 RepID=UPI0002046742|nr:ribonuclease PH [Candidatus Pelagibacter sp. IMCC9063]AEA80840.1 ribonuclease PH [Candidatus Pelagibacter sp. IMCC9063]|tara:strand:+ start:87 stop:800 length:714 start_codon:yes stop_codon:yes gene_type:complete